MKPCHHRVWTGCGATQLPVWCVQGAAYLGLKWLGHEDITHLHFVRKSRILQSYLPVPTRLAGRHRSKQLDSAVPSVEMIWNFLFVASAVTQFMIGTIAICISARPRFARHLAYDWEFIEFVLLLTHMQYGCDLILFL
jgi:hypothetical protein